MGASGHSHVKGRTCQMRGTAEQRPGPGASAARAQGPVRGSTYWRGAPACSLRGLGRVLQGTPASCPALPLPLGFRAPATQGPATPSSYKQDRHLELSSEPHGCSEGLRESQGLWGRTEGVGQEVVGGWGSRRSCSLPLLRPLLPSTVLHVPSLPHPHRPVPSATMPAPDLLRMPTWRALLPQQCPLPLLHP